MVNLKSVTCHKCDALDYAINIFQVLLFALGFVLPPNEVWRLSILLVAVIFLLPTPISLAASLKFMWHVQVEPPATDMLMAASLVKKVFQRRKIKIHFLFGPMVCLLIFNLINLLQVLASFDLYRAAFFAAVTFYVTMLLPYVFSDVGSYLPREKWPSALFWAIDLTALAIIIGWGIDMFGLAGRIEWLYSSIGRPRAFYKDANVAGPFIVFGLLFYISKFIFEGRPTGFTAAARILLYLLAVLLTFSRGAILNLIVGVMALAASSLFLGKRCAFLRSIALIVISISILVVAVPAFAVYSGQIRVLGINTYDVEGRIATWLAGILMFKDYPWGLGPGQYEIFSPTYQIKFIGNSLITPSAHNTYLRLLAENGLWGFGVFVCALGWTLLRLIRLLKRLKGQNNHLISAAYIAWIVSALLGVIVEGLVVDILHWRHFGLLLGLGISLSLHRVEPLTKTQIA